MRYALIPLLFLCFVLVETMAQQDDRTADDPPPPEFQFIGYSFTRMTTSNVAPTFDILQGQVIGRLFGRNSTTTLPRTAVYTEQRFVPMFIYTPSILDGFATFRGLFKIDYTWGDQAYGVGNNRGGAINAGQVNLQTLLANVEIRPHYANWNVVIGLQRLFDNVRDPNVIAVSTAMTSAYKLSFWGTQAVGINLFANLNPWTKGRLGFFQLWENVISRDDDVTLFMFDIESRVRPRLEIGGNVWYLRDRAKGAGGISVLGQGLTSALAEYNGALRLTFPGTTQRYEADIFWVGGYFAHNREFLAGRWWIDGFAIANFGTIDTVGIETRKAADILGAAANLHAAYRYGMTAMDRISVEGLFTTGDGRGAADGRVSSVITGNVYGSPVGIYSAHRALLLFPDPNVVSRYYSAVHDISNMGYGVSALFVNFYRDLIPNRFNAKLGIASALSNTKPMGGGHFIGTEFNFEVRYHLKVFLTWGLHAGYLILGDFYDAPRVTLDGVKPRNPWVIFTSLSWLMF